MTTSDPVLRIQAWISWRGAAIQDKSDCSIAMYLWRKLLEEFEVATRNTDLVEGQSKTDIDELNARFDAAWRWNRIKPKQTTLRPLCKRNIPH